MDIRQALKNQYQAGLAMLADCVNKCPDDLWTTPSRTDKHEDGWVCTRSFWRIALHTIYFTHLYLGQDEGAYQRPDGLEIMDAFPLEEMWAKPWSVEAYDLPEDAVPPTRKAVLEYIVFVSGLVDATIDGLDLESQENGLPWYKNFPKLEHQILNIRHLGIHYGQLSELLMQRGIDTKWVGRAGQMAAG